MRRMTKLGAISAVSFAIFTGLDLGLGPFSGIFYDPPNLLLALNVIFITGTNVAVAFLSARSYLKQGAFSILVLGSALLVSGLAALSAGLASIFSANANVTIFNIGILAASTLQVVTAFMVSGGPAIGSSRKIVLITAFVAVGAFVMLLSALTLDGFFPVFYTSVGPTLVRQAVVASAGFLFVLAFSAFILRYFRSKSEVFFWYSLAVGTISLSLFSSLAATQFTGILSWLTRMGQYLGGLYFLMAVASLRATMNGVIGLSDAWSETFADDREQLTTLLSNMREAASYHRVLVDRAGKPIDFVFLGANDAYERMTGLKRTNIVGRKITEVTPGIEKDSADWIGVYGRVALTGKAIQFESYSDLLDKWYSVSVFSPKKDYFVTLTQDITERKKAEKEIAALAKFPLENPAAVLRVDQRGIILFSNPPAREFLKEWKTEVRGRVPEHIRQIVVDALASERKIEFEANLGEKIFSFLATPIVTEDYVNLYGSDITERKKAEEAMRRQASLIDLSPDAIIVRTLEGVITFWSRGAEILYGWTAREASGQIIHTLLKTRFQEPLNDIVSQVDTSGRWFGELCHRTKDGRDLVVQSWWLAEKDEKGEIKDILESNIDITERKKTEEKLRESEVWEATSFYTRNLIETSLDPLVTINAEGKITDVNKATELVTGCSREELIGSDFSTYFTEPEKAAVGYKRVFTEGFVTDYPLAIRHKSGKITEVLYNASVYRNTAGDVQGVFAAARDVTERKNLEKQLQEKDRLAAIGATAGMVGHDVRNPLQAIVSDVYLVKSDLAPLPESQEKRNVQESLDAIEQNVGYINKIIEDLQDYARPLDPVVKETDIEALIRETIRKKSIPRNIKVSYRMASIVGKINTDPAILRRILENLVMNALQAMPNGGKLSIAARNNSSDTIITVQDSGVGIPEDVKPKLFRPMFTTKAKGQGFGLAVVKRMTEALGGTVTFESELGKGTEFILNLPHPKAINGKWTFGANEDNTNSSV